MDSFSSPAQDRLMTKRMEKMKMQTELKQLQSYRASLESFKANLENKDSELTNTLESTGKSGPSLQPCQSVLHHIPHELVFNPSLNQTLLDGPSSKSYWDGADVIQWITNHSIIQYIISANRTNMRSCGSFMSLDINV